MLRFQMDDAAIGRKMSNIEARQLPYATMLALNDTAADALALIQRQMDVVFDRPTRFTKNAFHVWRATKDALVAEVKERPSVGPRHYLKVQERGGVRPQTGVEKLLSTRLAYSGIIAAVIPAARAKRDAFGNWSSGERNQALSGLGAQRDRAANTTAASARRNRNRATFFVPDEGELSPGIWRRNTDGSIDKIALFTESMPSYKPRLGFYETAKAEAQEKFPAHFARRFAQAIATAR
ncbi:MAG: hypothetical protein ACK4S2_07010 [Gemmobacter sp.]|uniref:hypothetical protein n=1 Tax=Gemmobacter sp. TaxID=1898957 RepID=UPI00391BEC42